jgi:UDP-glucuronate decarboxylase
MNRVVLEDIDDILTCSIDWSKFANSTVMITGANGMLARYMVLTLIRLNDLKHLRCSIIAVVRSIAKAKVKFEEYFARPDLIFIEQDVCEEIKLNSKIDFIVHAASQASPKYYSIDPVGTLNANVIGLHNLLKLGARHSVKSFLFFSSSEVYGLPFKELEAVKETDYGYIDINNIRSCYAESKRLGETMCSSWSYQFKLPVKMVRPFHTYGPGMDLNDGRVFADFISDILNFNDITLKSKGDATRCFCYITDAVKAYFIVLLNGVTGEAYNIGNPKEEISILELAKLLLGIFPERNLKLNHIYLQRVEYLASPVKKITPDISKIRCLNWQPIVSIKDGFTKTILSYT